MIRLERHAHAFDVSGVPGVTEDVAHVLEHAIAMPRCWAQQLKTHGDETHPSQHHSRRSTSSLAEPASARTTIDARPGLGRGALISQVTLQRRRRAERLARDLIAPSARLSAASARLSAARLSALHALLGANISHSAPRKAGRRRERFSRVISSARPAASHLIPIARASDSG